MGGKSYFCDYCRCYLKNDINVRKTHNSGLMHNIAKANYMRRYEDPRKIFREEKTKAPCTRFPKGYCKFGLFCQYSHYSPTQLRELEEIARKLDDQSNNCTENVSNTNKKRKKVKRRNLKYRHLPPSLRPENNKTLKSKIQASQWG